MEFKLGVTYAKVTNESHLVDGERIAFGGEVAENGLYLELPETVGNGLLNIIQKTRKLLKENGLIGDGEGFKNVVKRDGLTLTRRYADVDGEWVRLEREDKESEYGLVEKYVIEVFKVEKTSLYDFVSKEDKDSIDGKTGKNVD